MKVHGVFCSDFNQTSLEDLCHVFDGSLTIMYKDFFHRFLPNIFLKSVRLGSTFPLSFIILIFSTSPPSFYVFSVLSKYTTY